MTDRRDMTDRRPTDDRPTTDELARRLEAYAQARLSPDAAASARLRARVMRAVHRAEGPSPAPAPLAVPTPAIVVPMQSRGPRVVTALLAAAFLLAAFAGATVAARPGGPLYEARLAVEEALLPTDPGARAAADLARLQSRLDEARAAANGGDAGAVLAALDAYQDLVDEKAAAAGDSIEHDTALEDALDHHLDVLNGLLTQVPDAALPGLERAIERSDRAFDRIHERGPEPEPGDEPAKEPPGQSGKPDHTPQGPPSDRPTGAPEDGES
jgi:hypothetical protein